MMTTSALLTDFYQLTMAQNYWDAGIAERQACFYMNFRKAPFGGRFAVAAGLGTLLETLQDFHFAQAELDFLAQLKNPAGETLFHTKFLTQLKNFTLQVNLDSVNEGEIVFADEPILRVIGPLWQAQLLETIILNTINFQTLIATKAARIALAAPNKSFMEFGLRRAHGPDGGLSASRAAFIGGCQSTSNVLASMRFDIPPSGTQAHSWIMSFDSEPEAFDAFAASFHDDYILLVDTYNSEKGIDHAISTAQKIKHKKLKGIRLDSGDLAHLSQMAREKLDAAGFTDAKIFASNDLDENVIAELERQHACIDAYGVGTRLVTGHEQGALGGVYKLSAVQNAKGEWQDKIKLSEQIEKVSSPGLLNVKRFFDETYARYDVIYDEQIGIGTKDHLIDPRDPTRRLTINPQAQGEDLLHRFIDNGKCIKISLMLSEIQEQVKKNLAHFHPSILRFLNPHHYPVGLESQLYEKKTALILKLRGLE